ncbi:MAG: delta-60 repeat domain-containing protein [Verrucomicrobiota bacterium]
MPTVDRYVVPGRVYHLIHRCHDRPFLFRFAKDRNGYRSRLVYGAVLSLALWLQIVCAAPGDVDLTFASGSGPDAPVTVVTVESRGTILIAGEFRSYDGVARPGLARLNASGQLDTLFNPPPVGTVTGIFLQSTGQVLLQADQPKRLNSDGSVDPRFQPPANTAKLLLVQPDDKLVVSSQTVTNGPQDSETRLLRLLPDGALDPSFSPVTLPYRDVFGVRASINDAIVDDGGSILASGTFQGFAVRVSTNGTVDLGFAPVLAGSYFLARGSAREIILWGNNAFDARIHVIASTGAELFEAQGMPVYVAPDGRILMLGFPVDQGQLNRLNPDWTLDRGFTAHFEPISQLPVRTVRVQADGAILVGGQFDSVNGQARRHLVRLMGDPIGPRLWASERNGGGFSSLITTATGLTYSLEANHSLIGSDWQLVMRRVGNGTIQKLVDTNADGSMRFYRLRVDIQ